MTTYEQGCSQLTKTNKTVTFKDLQELFTELIRLALLQGRESTKTLYGAGIQILNLLKCPSTDIQVPVDTVISRYQSTFTPTNEVTFTSSCMPIPQKPKPKPGSRDTETRICKLGDIHQKDPAGLPDVAFVVLVVQILIIQQLHLAENIRSLVMVSALKQKIAL